MQLKSPFIFLLRASAFQAALAACNSLHTYSVPDEVPESTAYSVRARTSGGDWKDLGTFETDHHEVDLTAGRTVTHHGTMAYFDFSGTVDVSITYNGAGSVSSTRVRPDSYGIEPEVEENSIFFTLDEPRNLVIHATEDVFDVLHLFSNPIETDVPDADDPNVVYYGPGYHEHEGDLRLRSGQTLYLAGGAVLKAAVRMENVTDTVIRGHGILYRSREGGVTAWNSNNVTIEDIIFLMPGRSTVQIAEGKDILIRGIRSFSAIGWGDGIMAYCSENVLIDGVFLRTSDDSISLYNHRDDWYGNSTNITVQNSAFWADVAHAINIGTHGNTQTPEVMSGITIRNVDLLDHREYQVGYQGCIAITCGDSNLIENVLIEDVRVENFRHGQIINLAVNYNPRWNTSPGRGIRNVTIRNLDYKGDRANAAVLAGYDETRGIEFVEFQNLVVNGRKISNAMTKPGWYEVADLVPMYVNSHVKNLTFVD